MKFSASKALSESFAIFSGRFTTMAPIALLFTLVPLVIFMASFGASFAGLQQNQGNPVAMMQAMLAMIGSFALIFFLYMVVRTAGVCALCAAAASRQASSVGDAIREGLRALVPMIGIYLLLIVCYIVIGVVLFLTVGLSFAAMFSAASSGAQQPGAASVGGIVLVMFLVMFAMLYVFTKLSMIVPAVVVDKERSPFKAIARSWSLTRGAAFKIFLLFLLMGIGAGIINAIVNALSGGAVFLAPNSAGTVVWSQVAVAAVTGTAFAMYFIALIVAIHEQLAGPSVAAISDTFE